MTRRFLPWQLCAGCPASRAQTAASLPAFGIPQGTALRPVGVRSKSAPQSVPAGAIFVSRQPQGSPSRLRVPCWPVCAPSWRPGLGLPLRTAARSLGLPPRPRSPRVDVSVREPVSGRLPFSAVSVWVFLFASLRSPLRFLSSTLVSVRRFPTVWKPHPQASLLRTGSPSPPPLSLFSALPFVLPYSEEIGLSFYKSGVLCQRLEVVLWESLQVEVIFWSVCGGKGGLPVLFLLHLEATLHFIFLITFSIEQQGETRLPSTLFWEIFLA